MRKPSGPPPKGQKAITSFIFRKQPDPKTTNDLDQKQGEPEQKTPPIQPPKEIQTHKQPPNPLAPESKEKLHQKWQSKLAQDDPSKRRSVEASSQQPQQKMTPLELQVASLKQKHPNIILAIECGYKYRFFGLPDAEIASQVLNIFAYQDRNYLTASVPTFTIDKHIRRLVNAGYKVGLVSQTESAAIKAASADTRNKPFERTLTAVFTRATIEAGALSSLSLSAGSSSGDKGTAHQKNGGGGDNDDVSMLMTNEERSSFFVCVVEAAQSNNSNDDNGDGDNNTNTTNTTDIAIIAIESSTGHVIYSHIKDNPMRLQLESTLLFTPPADLLIVEPVSTETRRLLEKMAPSSLSLSGQYIQQHNNSNNNSSNSKRGFECVSNEAYKEGGALSRVIDFYRSHESIATTYNNTTMSNNNNNNQPSSSTIMDRILSLPPLVITALAHSLDYLEPFGLEGALIHSTSFKEYSEIKELSLSPNALQQLEILRNSDDGKERGSLLWLMDRTLTAPGSRLMRRWVSRPLTDVVMIRDRLDAVKEMIDHGSDHRILSTIPSTLKSLPDLERLLGRTLHGTATPAEFSILLTTFTDLYSKFGMQADLTSPPTTINTSNTTINTNTPNTTTTPMLKLDNVDVTSSLLTTLLHGAADLRCAIAAQRTLAMIDQQAASSNDIVNLLINDNERFPEVVQKRCDVSTAKDALNKLLPQFQSELGIGKRLEYTSVHNQGDYLIEIPADMEKKAPKTWEKISSTKKFVRFRPPQVKAAVASLDLAKEYLTLCAKNAWKQLLREFSAQYYMIFRDAIQSLAALDCLNSFALVAVAGNYVCPEFIDIHNGDHNHPQLHVVQGRHPVMDVLLEGAFVPNDIHLDGGSSSITNNTTNNRHNNNNTNISERCAIVTGPNMGGKSCFIRQAALLVCMAQAGSFVPAQSCKLHVFDAIYTRMGAADNIALGRSTFLEELSETSTILSNATSRSLVVIDELGRGTSTRDGMAIAETTLEYLVNRIGCLCLFVTHYPEVAGLHERLPGVGSYYMAHLVEDDISEEQKSAVESVRLPKVTFLYRVTRGVASASYGLNVANMAGLPRSVVVKAARKAEEMKNMSQQQLEEDDVERVAEECVASVLKSLGDGDDVRGVLEGIQKKVKVELIL